MRSSLSLPPLPPTQPRSLSPLSKNSPQFELDDDLHSPSPSPSSNGEGERTKSSIPRGWPGSQPPPSEQDLHDGSKAVRELGLRMTPRGKTVWDTWGSLERLRGV